MVSSNYILSSLEHHKEYLLHLNKSPPQETLLFKCKLLTRTSLHKLLRLFLWPAWVSNDTRSESLYRVENRTCGDKVEKKVRGAAKFSVILIWYTIMGVQKPGTFKGHVWHRCSSVFRHGGFTRTEIYERIYAPSFLLWCFSLIKILQSASNDRLQFWGDYMHHMCGLFDVL